MQKLILVVGLTMVNLQAFDTAPKPAGESARQTPTAPITAGPTRRSQPTYQWDGRLPFRLVQPTRR